MSSSSAVRCRLIICFAGGMPSAVAIVSPVKDGSRTTNAPWTPESRNYKIHVNCRRIYEQFKNTLWYNRCIVEIFFPYLSYLGSVQFPCRELLNGFYLWTYWVLKFQNLDNKLMYIFHVTGSYIWVSLVERFMIQKIL